MNCALLAVCVRYVHRAHERNHGHGQERVRPRTLVSVEPPVRVRVHGAHREPGRRDRPAAQPSLDHHRRQRQRAGGARRRRGRRAAGAAPGGELRVHELVCPGHAVGNDAGNLPDGDRSRTKVRRRHRALPAGAAFQFELSAELSAARKRSGSGARTSRVKLSLAAAIGITGALAASSTVARAQGGAADPMTPPMTAPIETPATPGGGGAVQSLNPDLSFIADVAAGWFSKTPPLQTGEHDPHGNGFSLQQLELAASSAVDPYFRFDSFIVFKVPRAGEDGGVEIEEVYATTTSLPGNLQLRVGQFLTRFGRFNATHPHTWDFVDQPLEIGRLISADGNRGLGAELSYLTPLPWYVEALASVTHDSAMVVSHPGNFQLTGAVKQFFPLSDDWSLMWGLSAAGGSDPSVPADPVGRARIGGSDLYLKYRPLGEGRHTIVSLQAEWFYRRRDVGAATLHDTGGFAALFWRFAQRWATAARWEMTTASRNGAGLVTTPACAIDDPNCIDAAFATDVQ